ncbi:hypothetical protein DFH27DRAFT_626229 [Peziza echinospora]|nr:hypothetical protein DFH27DRAFT_626229 [Peziza echinospora]
MTTQVELREQIFNLKFDIHTSGEEFFVKLQRLQNRLTEMDKGMDQSVKITTLLHIFKNKEITTFKDSLIARITSKTTYQEVVSMFKTFIKRKQEELNIDTSYVANTEEGNYFAKSNRGGRGRGCGRPYRGRGGGGSRGGYASGSSNGKETRKCFSCNQYGHLAQDCDQNQRRESATGFGDKDVGEGPNPTPTEDDDRRSAIEEEQAPTGA